MAKVIDEILVCSDCLMVIANDDWTGIRLEDINRVKIGIRELAQRGYACVGDSNKDHDFEHSYCDCCGALPGSRHHVVILGEE
jgi:hypothetical protein